MSARVPLFCSVQGEGPDLVLLHPAGLDHTFMDQAAQAFSDSYRVLSVDLRGHGLSPDAAPGTRLQDLASDVLDVIERHCKAAPVVVGISLGGMVAQVLALDHPAAASALVLCGCTGTFDAKVRPVLRERGLAAKAGGMAAVVDATVARWFTPGALATPAADKVRGRLLGNAVSNWCVTWHAIAAHNALPRLGEIAVPVLVIAGECDAATPLAAARHVADAIDRASWVCVPGAPHMMQLECTEAFISAVGPFLQECRAGANGRPTGAVL